MLDMKFFAFITLFSAFMLFYSKPFSQDKRPVKRDLPSFIRSQQRSFKESFHSPQNANVLWAFLTGQKSGISPMAQKSFNDLELNFLFSPSGLHLASLMALFIFFVKKFKHKKLTKIFQLVFLLAALFLPYLAIKRIVCFRILLIAQSYLKKRIPVEVLFLLTFFISFLLGHYQESPLGFILSFLYMGTFIALSEKSKFILVLGLFSSHLLLNFFSGSEISFLALIFNIPLIALFTFLLPFFYLYLFTFKLIHFNWIELIVRFFIVTTNMMAKLLLGSFMSSTLFLMLAIWVILLKKKKRYLVVLFFLHANLANSPALFSQSHIL